MKNILLIFLSFFISGIHGQDKNVFLNSDLKKDNPIIYYSYKGDKNKVLEILNADPKLINVPYKYVSKDVEAEGIILALITVFSLGAFDYRDAITAVDASVAGGHYDLTKILLAKGALPSLAVRSAIVNKKNNILDSLMILDKRNAYYLAAYGEHAGNIKYAQTAFDKYKFYPNSSGPKGEAPILILSVPSDMPYTLDKNPERDFFYYMVSLKSIDLNVTDTCGNTALMKAYDRSNKNSFEHLLKLGADLNFMNKGGYTLLDKTITEKNPEGDPYLLKIGARSSEWTGFRALKRGDEFYEQLQWSSYDGSRKEKIAAMSQDTFPMKFKNTEVLKNAVRASIWHTDINAVRMLQSFNVNWNDSLNGEAIGQSRYTRTSFLEYAISKCKPELVAFLLKNGATTDLNNSEGKTLIHRLIENHKYCQDTMVKLLCKAGADINARDNNGKSPLWYAIEANYEGTKAWGVRTNDQTLTIDLLLDLGADINLTNNNGNTIMDLLQDADDKKYLIKQLKKKGALTSKKLQK